MPASRCWADAIRRAREAIVNLPCRKIDRTGAVLARFFLAGRTPVATVISPFWHSRGATAKGQPAVALPTAVPFHPPTPGGRDRRPRRGSMKIRPLQDPILVKRIEEEEKTKGGIIIPDTAKEKPSEGRVIAVGKGKVSEDGKLTPLDVKKGDRLLFTKYSGH